MKKSSKEPVIKNKSDECYSLNAWIKKELDFLEDTNEYLDLYVENKYTYTQEDVIINNPKKNSSRRIDELDKFKNMEYKSKNLRFHYMDTRFVFNEDRNHALVFKLLHMIKRIGKSTKNLRVKFMFFILWADETMREYSSICANSKNFIVDIESFFERKMNEKIHQTLEEYTSDMHNFLEILRITKIMSKKYKRMNLHPIGKQFRKLLDQEKYDGDHDREIFSMSEFIIQRWKYISNLKFFSKTLGIELICLNKKIFDDYTNNKLSEDKFYNYILTFFHLPYVMDLYAIPRILYSLPNSSLKIYSAGFNHVETLFDFILEFYEDIQIKKFIPKKQMRCIHTKKGEVLENVSEINSEFEDSS